MRLLTLRRGTGASYIYALLGCKARPKWKFAGTGNSNYWHVERGKEADSGLMNINKSISFAKHYRKWQNLGSRKTRAAQAETEPIHSRHPTPPSLLPRCSLDAPSCSLTALLCSPGAPSKAALLPFSSRNGNRES